MNKIKLKFCKCDKKIRQNPKQKCFIWYIFTRLCYRLCHLTSDGWRYFRETIYFESKICAWISQRRSVVVHLIITNASLHVFSRKFVFLDKNWIQKLLQKVNPTLAPWSIIKLWNYKHETITWTRLIFFWCNDTKIKALLFVIFL